MKRFQFRLQRVLEIKETIEEAKRRDFSSAFNQYQKKLYELNEMIQTLRKYQNELYEIERNGVDLHRFLYYFRFFTSFKSQILYQERMVKIANTEMEKRRTILIEAVKERKIIERLKEKKFQQYHYEAGKEEQFHLDDISSGKVYQRMNKNNYLDVQVEV